MADDLALTARDVAGRAELLDDAHVDDDLRLRVLADVARANHYFGGARVLRREFQQMLREDGCERLTVLDVGTATGDLSGCIRQTASRHAVRVKLLGIDLRPALARAARHAGTAAVCGNGLALPFRRRSMDVVVCSQLLHHFDDAVAVRLLCELDRVGRRRIIVCDLRRSALAAAAFWLASHPLRFHPITRHDGVASVRRGFTGPELTRLVYAAVGQRPVARPSLGFRLAVSWDPASSSDVRCENLLR